MDTPKRIFFFVGRTASGKETQSKLLAEKLDCQIFSTGAEFRREIASGSVLGKRMQETYDAGRLMPAWIADYLFENFILNLPVEKHAIFEGSGRDVEQARTIAGVTDWLERPYTVLNLVISPETVVARSLGRKRDATDTEEVIRTRLAEYERLTAPALEYFRERGTLVEIDGEKPVEDIHAQVMTHVAKLTH